MEFAKQCEHSIMTAEKNCNLTWPENLFTLQKSGDCLSLNVTFYTWMRLFNYLGQSILGHSTFRDLIPHLETIYISKI